jgi:adenine-specific DNA glycosylase
MPPSTAGGTPAATLVQAAKHLGLEPCESRHLCTIKHSITRYRITLEAFHVQLGGWNSTTPKIPRARGARFSEAGIWLTPAQMNRLALASAHKKLARTAANCILSGR